MIYLFQTFLSFVTLRAHLIIYDLMNLRIIDLPNTVAARSKAWTVFTRSNSGIVGSNPIQSMDVCIVWVYSVFVSICV
jgi:hypothetical protein